MFDLIQTNRRARAGKRCSVAISVAAEVGLLTVALLVPAIRPELLSQRQLSTRLIFPMPPSPRAPQLEPKKTKLLASARVTRVFKGRLMAPSAIPEKVEMIEEPRSMAVSYSGFDQDGVVGMGRLGNGLPDGIGDPLRNYRPPAPPSPKARAAPPRVAAAAPPPKPVRVGGDVQEAKLIRKVVPHYPEIPRRLRISGKVELVGIIGIDGHIRELRVLRGHPLLVPAATGAVQQWVYRPTYLNGAPVEVEAPITVTFTLSQ